jgi:hypothetical protein
MVISGQALVTREAAISHPANADTLANLEALGFYAEGDDGADGFMSGNEREFRHAPLVVEHRDIRVADPAVRDFDFDFFGAEFTRVEGERLQCRMGRGGGVGVKCGHKVS